MSDQAETLADLERRIELLSTEPARVRAPWTRLVRPILKGLGWRAKLEVDSLNALLSGLSSRREDVDLDDLVESAVDELAANVGAVERACVVNGRIGIAHAAWLRRVFEVVLRACRAVASGSELERRMIERTDPARLLPPLGPRGVVADPPKGAEAAPDDRLLDLQLAAVDHLLDAARDERAFLARKRRLLEAAREVLLDTAAALPLDADAVEARRALIARQIVRLDRLQAAGVDPDVALLHQARTAVSRGDRARLHAVLVALDDAASASFDSMVSLRTRAALEKLRQGAAAPMNVRDSLERSAREAFGRDVVAKMREGMARARAGVDAAKENLPPMLHGAADAFVLADPSQTFAAALAVDGAFEVGGALSPVRVTEIETRLRVVPWPTQQLVLMPAKSIEDVAAAVIDDPRTILLNLATGRLLTRKYVEEERVERRRTKLVGEVRVYVLDGSGSMIGPRARMRDAMLVAELATMLRRFESARRVVRVTLFYRFFDLELGPVTRVADPASALAAISDVIGTVRGGGTNIENALIASIEQVREARRADPDLARAQIVLVTDGQAPVDEAKVEAARQGLDDVRIAVSVIALGEENPVLRALVAKQRAAGERAFYHFVPDSELAAIANGEIDRGGPLHLPELEDDARRSPVETARVLQSELGGLLDELADLDRKRDLEAIEREEAEQRAAQELGVELDGASARRAAIARDVRALERRFTRWFPRVEGTEDLDGEGADEVYVVLSTVAEVVSIVGGTPLARRAEAIETLERILPDAGLSPAKYLRVLRANPARLGPAVAAVHAAVEPKAA